MCEGIRAINNICLADLLVVCMIVWDKQTCGGYIMQQLPADLEPAMEETPGELQHLTIRKPLYINKKT